MGEAKRRLKSSINKVGGFEVRTLVGDDIKKFFDFAAEAENAAPDIATIFVNLMSRKLDAKTFDNVAANVCNHLMDDRDSKEIADNLMLQAIWKKYPGTFGKTPDFYLWNCCFELASGLLSNNPTIKSKS